MTPRQQEKVAQANRVSQALLVMGSAITLSMAIARGRVKPGRWYAIYPNDRQIQGTPYGR